MVDRFVQTNPAFLYLWGDRALYLGRFLTPISIAYGVAALIVSLDEPINLEIGSNALVLRSALLPAGVPVNIDVKKSVVAIIHLDCLGKDYRQLENAFEYQSGRVLIQLKQEDLYIRLLNRVYSHANINYAYAILNKLLLESFSLCSDTYSVDSRIMRVADFVRSHYKQNTPVEELAYAVGLSPSRLTYLFKAQTGIPIRRFRLWYRLYQSIFTIHDGNCLTNAALASGFSDLAHYSNTFYSMWGLSPSSLLLGKNGTRILTG